MASASKHLWGFKVNLNHAEACGWTAVTGGGTSTTDLVAKIVEATGAAWLAGPYGLAVAAFILASSTYIRSLNEESGGKGVTLKFAWPGVYFSTRRRGRGSSPCG